jgi:hypothetical protein
MDLEDAGMQVYFSLRDGSETIPDGEGVEVSSVEDAKTEALRAIREMRGENETAARDWDGWKLEASDDKGALLFTLRLDASH